MNSWRGFSFHALRGVVQSSPTSKQFGRARRDGTKRKNRSSEAVQRARCHQVHAAVSGPLCCGGERSGWILGGGGRPRSLVQEVDKGKRLVECTIREMVPGREDKCFL